MFPPRDHTQWNASLIFRGRLPQTNDSDSRYTYHAARRPVLCLEDIFESRQEARAETIVDSVATTPVSPSASEQAVLCDFLRLWPHHDCRVAAYLRLYEHLNERRALRIEVWLSWAVDATLEGVLDRKRAFSVNPLRVFGREEKVKGVHP